MATAPTTANDERRLVTGGDPDERAPGIPEDKDFLDHEGNDTEFLPAADLESIGKALIENRGEFRDIADARIDFRWKLSGGASGGKITLGKCVKASGLVAHYSACDFVIWLAADHARALEMTCWQVEALVYHELCHAAPAFDSEGEQIGWKTRAHDFEGFRQEVDRYGLWQADLKAAAKAMQLRLFELESGDSDDGETGGDDNVTPIGKPKGRGKKGR